MRKKKTEKDTGEIKLIKRLESILIFKGWSHMTVL